MIYKGIDVHGAAYLETAENGVIPRRYPENVRQALNTSGKTAALNLCGVELRFVPEGDVTITLSTVGEKALNRAQLYYGNTQAGWETGEVKIDHTPREITFRQSARTAFLDNAAAACGHPFKPTVLRLALENAQIIIHNIEGNVRPPKADELPNETILFYGSSITHGSLAAAPSTYWTRRVAENLRRDHVNLGLAGSCLAQREVADWIASRNDWQTAVLEMGINMVDNVESEDYRSRVRYMLETVHAAHPDKYKFCVDVFYYYGDLFDTGRVKEYRKIMAEEVARIGSDRVVHISGLDILTGVGGLSEDMVHPNVTGVEEIARNMTAKLSAYLK